MNRFMKIILSPSKHYGNGPVKASTGPGKLCTAAFDWANTGTKQQKSKCVKSRSKVHQSTY